MDIEIKTPIKMKPRVEKIGEGTYGKVYQYSLHNKIWVEKITDFYDSHNQQLCISNLTEMCYYKLVSGVSKVNDLKMDILSYKKSKYRMNIPKYDYCLTKFIKNNTIEVRKSLFLKVFEQLSRNLIQLHDIGISHGDLKPNNIVINADGELSIIDYGTFMYECLNNNISPGCTYEYQAPELFREYFPVETEIFYHGPFNDVWSFGLIVLEYLIGYRVNYLEEKHDKFRIKIIGQYITNNKIKIKKILRETNLFSSSEIDYYYSIIKSCLVIDHSKRITMRKWYDKMFNVKLNTFTIKEKVEIYNNPIRDNECDELDEKNREILTIYTKEKIDLTIKQLNDTLLTLSNKNEIMKYIPGAIKLFKRYIQQKYSCINLYLSLVYCLYIYSALFADEIIYKDFIKNIKIDNKTLYTNIIDIITTLQFDIFRNDVMIMTFRHFRKNNRFVSKDIILYAYDVGIKYHMFTDEEQFGSVLKYINNLYSVKL